MTRKRFGLIALGLLLAVGAVGGGVIWGLSQTPDFYRQVMADDVDPVVQKAEAKRFTQRTMQLVSDIKNRDRWAKEFTQLQVNSWFAVELVDQFQELLPEGVEDPRIVLRDGTMLVGFKFEYDGWAGVVSFQVKPWVPEPNQLALEIQSIKAGLVPIPLDEVLKEIGGEMEDKGWKVTWKQRDGNDVMVIDFGEREKKKSLLESVKVLDGKIRVAGKGEGKSAGKTVRQ